MKKVISLILTILALASPTMKAQEHATFLGIPINGRLSQFCNKLVSQKGLTIVEKDDSRGVYTLSGKFMNYNNCEFYVFDNDNTKQTYHIDVYLPEQSTWRGILNQYKRIVNDYRTNSTYTFDEDKATFSSPYREGGGNEVEAVKEGKVDYYTYFTYKGGLLKIQISRYMQVELSFYDVANYPFDDSDNGGGTGAIGGTGGTGGTGGGTGGTVTPTPAPTPAPSTSPAMTFLNIPMRGTINDFAQQLVNQKGCTIVSVNEGSNSISMRGQFTGKDCEIYVFGTPQTKQVWKVTVYLPEQSTWRAIKAEYLEYKSKFDTNIKYTLTSSYDFFSDPYEEGDGKEVEGIKADKCHYSAFYDAENGNVMLKVSKYMQVQISYEDTVNCDLNTREKQSNNDI